MIDELGQRAALALDNARLYEEAEAARREAERANRVKDEFLGISGTSCAIRSRRSRCRCA
jgi:GAF domain-containing protein